MDELSCYYKPLKFDEACVNVISDNNNYNMWLYSLSTDCLSCPYKRIARISTNKNSSLKFSTIDSLKWRVLKNNGSDEYISAKNTSDIFCELLPNLGQYGLYELIIQNKTCNCKTLRNPTYPYSELFIILAIIIFILLGISAGRSLWYKLKTQCIMKEETASSNKEATKHRRIKAIDTFRGVSTLFMIFVNAGSGSYTTLGHATWNGILLGDLVFPCFIWIMGVCIPVALSAQLRRGLSKLQISYSILKRSFLLFLIGVALNTLGTNAQLENIRIFGILQRFGISYLIVGLLYLLIPQQSKAAQKLSQTLIMHKMQDVLNLLPHWCIMLTLVMMHCALTFGLPIPGCPTGYLGPGGRHEDGKYFNCTGGAAGYIDRILLTLSHIYQKPTIDSVYGSGPFDPEGILGCLTSIFQVFLGVHTGIILMMYKDWKERIIRWLSWAMFYGCLGCAFHFTNLIPINKNLWSLSFVLVSSCFALIFLSGCYLLIDITKIWQGGPFRIPGMNALVLYVGHNMCYQIFPFHWKIGAMDSRALCLIESIWVVTLWTIIAYVMHRKRIYITL
ncbi:hypothetical protein ACFW04_002959 [Cataglyphis niger]